MILPTYGAHRERSKELHEVTVLKELTVQREPDTETESTRQMLQCRHDQNAVGVNVWGQFILVGTCRGKAHRRSGVYLPRKDEQGFKRC